MADWESRGLRARPGGGPAGEWHYREEFLVDQVAISGIKKGDKAGGEVRRGCPQKNYEVRHLSSRVEKLITGYRS